MISLFRKKKVIPHRTIEDLKNIVKILIVDNEPFSLENDLKEKEHWRNVTRIPDVESISQTEVKEAHIICVDVQGVGVIMGFPDEGLGLIKAIKETYPEKKVIMYSAETQGKVDAFHPADDVVDGRMKKTSTRYNFEVTIERLAKDAFCLENCVRHIKDLLYSEFNIDKDEKEISSLIQQLYSQNKPITNSLIEKVFNLQNAGSIASIISLLIQNS